MGHAKEIITIDVYGDTAEIIEDCLDELQPFIDEVIPEQEAEETPSGYTWMRKGQRRNKESTDFSEDDYMDCLEAVLA